VVLPGRHRATPELLKQHPEGHPFVVPDRAVTVIWLLFSAVIVLAFALGGLAALGAWPSGHKSALEILV
jgi:hypothetical protein